MSATTLTTHASHPAEAATNSAVLRHAQVKGLNIAYREAGDRKNPTFVLLHGFPSSSFMYRNLLPLLAERFHVIAPDYVGFGDSAAPQPGDFEYSFDHLAEHVEALLQQLGLDRYYLYMQDYGGPIGLRLATAKPQAVLGLVIQNANSYVEGISRLTSEAFMALWQSKDERGVSQLLAPATVQYQYAAGSRKPADLDPRTWTHDTALLSRPGSAQAQMALFRDYQNNLAKYPQWQAYLREQQPKTLVVWGDGDPLFTPAGADAYGRDLPDLAIHHLDTGHFALEEDAALIADLILTYFS
ncbi:alpha/beta fold hydrolase [Roseateles oligotrophus]|uniref:Alpha/beta hydrolase n=1 Tax=Roseateles oligotrophus TaxID=1769250 RepID=A0ABT2YGL0_9BURK|nr:alpha/beta hydrolase [Roseateles oligotrophus]MCV2369164.1 alpha/beta hydrolase [Roseateles oligotrophus]